MDQENIKSFETQLRKGLLTYCILSITSHNRVYTAEMIAKLKDANMIVTEGTLYPLLNRLSKSGYLNHQWEESSGGPPKKYYSISESGEVYLQQLKKSWSNINNSVNNITKEKK